MLVPLPGDTRWNSGVFSSFGGAIFLEPLSSRLLSWKPKPWKLIGVLKLAAGDDTEVADGGVWTMVALGAVGMAGSHCVVRVQEYCGDWGGIQVAAGCC